MELEDIVNEEMFTTEDVNTIRANAEEIVLKENIYL